MHRNIYEDEVEDRTCCMCGYVEDSEILPPPPGDENDLEVVESICGHLVHKRCLKYAQDFTPYNVICGVCGKEMQNLFLVYPEMKRSVDDQMKDTNKYRDHMLLRVDIYDNAWQQAEDHYAPIIHGMEDLRNRVGVVLGNLENNAQDEAQQALLVTLRNETIGLLERLDVYNNVNFPHDIVDELPLAKIRTERILERAIELLPLTRRESTPAVQKSARENFDHLVTIMHKVVRHKDSFDDRVAQMPKVRNMIQTVCNNIDAAIQNFSHNG